MSENEQPPAKAPPARAAWRHPLGPSQGPRGSGQDSAAKAAGAPPSVKPRLQRPPPRRGAAEADSEVEGAAMAGEGEGEGEGVRRKSGRRGGRRTRRGERQIKAWNSKGRHLLALL
eukprot:1029687-Pyramimonas_sp.AAC.1